jgi:transcriptional regulator with XRE-family HTH domain
MDLAADLGRILTNQRETILGKSRRALAMEHGISDVALLDIEHGRANPTFDRVERLAEVYGIELTITAASGALADITPKRMPRTS